MRKTRIFISTLLIFNLLAVPQLAVMGAEAEVIRAQVIDSVLSDAYEAEGAFTKQSTLVYIEDIEHPARISETLLTNEQSASISPESRDTEGGSTQEEIAAMQALISKRRAESRKLYTAQNTAFAEKYIDSEDVIYISRYSPVIITSLDQTEVNQLALKSQVTSIELYAPSNANEVFYEEENDETLTAPVTADTTAIDTAIATLLDRINVTSVQEQYTGEGIKIGVIDAGVPEKEYHDEYNVVKHESTYGSYEEDPHASNVAKILHSIAPKAELYCVACPYRPTTEFYQYIPAIEWLLDQEVNIINSSFVLGYDAYNTYGTVAKWLDYISLNSIVSIVKSAGNSPENGIYSGGMAYNCITVGAVEASGVLRSDSSYSNISSSTASKPDICAFGYSILTEHGEISQTSMATPQVAGAIALMCQQNDILLAFPETQKAIITAGVNRDEFQSKAFTTVPYNTDNEYYKYGAGILDCNRNYQIIRDKTFYNGYLRYGSTGTYETKTLPFSKNKTIRMSLAYSRDVTLNGTEHIPSSLPDLELTIQLNQTLVLSTNTTNNSGLNIKINSFTPTQTANYNTNLLVQTTSNGHMYYGIAWCSN